MGALPRFCLLALLCVPIGALAQLDDLQSLFQTPPQRFQFDSREGILKLDVVVTGKSGAPIAGLSEQQFALLDDGQPQKPLTFAAYDNVKSFPDPPASLIFVLDGLNMDAFQLASAERALKSFLLRNGGHLDQPASIYRLAHKGLLVSQSPSMNGPDVVRQIENDAVLRVVQSAPQLPDWVPSCMKFGTQNSGSLDWLGAIVLEQRRIPGRKVVIWIGPGWPAVAPEECANSRLFINSFDLLTEYSTRMREARIALYNVNPWADANPGFDYRLYMGGVTRRSINPVNFTLQVLAANSGGEAPATERLEQAFERIAGLASAFYTLTFDPRPTINVDEYHAIQVKVNVPAATASTWTGYYDEPSFYDQPPPFEPVSVAQLESRLNNLKSMRDREVAKQLSRLQLTERLSTARLAEWNSRLSDRKDTLRALMVLADQSVSLPLPAADIPQDPAPSLGDQRAMLALTVNYLAHVIPTLPDFFAQRSIELYSEDQPKDQTWKVSTGDGRLGESRLVSETVHYRSGREEVEGLSREIRSKRADDERLDAVGTFGAILNIVIPDAAQSRLEWGRWEQTPQGLRAVFRFAVPSAKSRYKLSYCCVDDRTFSGPWLHFDQTSWTAGYHGELMIDPGTGEILRLTLQAGLKRLPMSRADLMVSYAPAQIGDRTYLCPQHSVAIVRKRTRMELHEWGGELVTFGPFRTMLNDITYSNYRKFGSTARILPGFTEAQP